MSFTLPELGYAYDALEPFIDKETMEIHHSRHHQAYINNANTALSDFPELLKLCPNELAKNLNLVPEAKRTAARNNVGGHANHSLFWQTLKTGTTLSGKLEQAIINDFGSVDEFKAQFEAAATTRFGSGWAWLVVKDGKLSVVSTANQDSPLMGKEVAGVDGYPIIGLDVWEHAYYLKYQNKRPDYIKAYWNVVNWDVASERFLSQI